jgi:uncharacterized protein (TIGR03437 family)
MQTLFLALLVAVSVEPGAPSISPGGLVNAATGQPAVAPYSIAALYGTNLFLNGAANSTGGVEIPETIAGVTVQVGGAPAGLFYISANQINLLIPNSIAPGTYPVIVVRSGIASQSQLITIQPFAPGIFAATHADSTPITADAPAVPGEVVIFYATGLGPALPNPPDRSVSPSAAPIVQFAAFQVQLDGATLDPSLIQYAGLAPFSAGLYQVNVQLPQNLPLTNPQVILNVAGVQSQGGFTLITTSD